MGSDIGYVVVMDEEYRIVLVEIDLDPPEENGESAMELLELDVVAPSPHFLNISRFQNF